MLIFNISHYSKKQKCSKHYNYSEGLRIRSHNNLMSHPRDILEYIMDWQELLASVPSILKNNRKVSRGVVFYFKHRFSRKSNNDLGKDHTKKFDFSNNRIDIEIKTSLNRHIHTFSDEQLQDMSPLLKRYIFSHYLDGDVSGGQSLSGLVNEIRDILTRVELFEKSLWKLEYLI